LFDPRLADLGSTSIHVGTYDPNGRRWYKLRPASTYGQYRLMKWDLHSCYTNQK